MDDTDRYRCRRMYLAQSDYLISQVVATCDALVNIEGTLLAAPLVRHCIHIYTK